MSCSVAQNSNIYPGELATHQQLKLLADEYRAAAQTLQMQGRKGHPLSRAPYRLAAIHAIELYLNALLLQKGHDASQIRALQHHLGARMNKAQSFGLTLKKRTAAHLESLEANREYLVTRYGPEMTASISQINRLSATLEEVANKVTLLLSKNEQLA